jgi:hypothetical protein
VRHRAARPSFTVEIKHRRQKPAQALTTGKIAKRESCPWQGQLGQEQGASAQTALPPNLGGLFNVNLAMASRSPSHTVDRSDTRDCTPLAELPTRRILPSILSAQAAAPTLNQEVGELIIQRHRTKSQKVKVSRRALLPAPEATPYDKPTGHSTTVLEGETSLGNTPDVSGSVPADKHREMRAVAPLIVVDLREAEAVAENCMRAPGWHASRGTPRRTHRGGGTMPLRRGERWKRRLPKVCW